MKRRERPIVPRLLFTTGFLFKCKKRAQGHQLSRIVPSGTAFVMWRLTMRFMLLLHQTPTKVNGSTYASGLSRQSRRAAGYKWPDYPRRDAKLNQTLFNAFSINTSSQVPYRTVPTNTQPAYYFCNLIINPISWFWDWPRISASTQPTIRCN